MLNLGKRSLFVASAFVLAASLAVDAFAASNYGRKPYAVETTTTTATDYGSSNAAGKFAFGMERYSGPLGGAINALHAMVGVTPDMWIGVGFGCASNFDNLVAGVDFRYHAINKGAASLFGELKAGIAKAGGGDIGFAFGPLLGLQYALTSNLKVSFAYGLEFGFGGAFSDKHFGTTNNGFEGNFGIHWFL